MSWNIAVTDIGVFQVRRDLPLLHVDTVVSEHASEQVALRELSALYACLHSVALADREIASTPAGANAPYKILLRDGKYVVVNNTGGVKSTFDNRDDALAYLRALYASVKGAAARAAKVKYTGNAMDRMMK